MWEEEKYGAAAGLELGDKRRELHNYYQAPLLVGGKERRPTLSELEVDRLLNKHSSSNPGCREVCPYSNFSFVAYKEFVIRVLFLLD